MKRILTLIFILFVCLSGKAQEVEISGSRKAVRTSGDVLAFVTPVASLTTVLVLQDWKGLKQGALAGVSTIGMTYALKYLIKKERPDGSDKHSFPSMHTSVSFTGAAFIQRRYGWKWGIPAYAIASYVGWSRTYAKKHDWWDVVAGAALGAGSAYIFTRPFATKHNLSISPVASDSPTARRSPCHSLSPSPLRGFEADKDIPSRHHRTWRSNSGFHYPVNLPVSP